MIGGRPILAPPPRWSAWRPLAEVAGYCARAATHGGVPTSPAEAERHLRNLARQGGAQLAALDGVTLIRKRMDAPPRDGGRR